MQPDQVLHHYHDLLLKWQKTINLVSPTTLSNAWDRHFEDSLQLLPYLPKDIKEIADIGSGAGFPGLIIALSRPDIVVNMIESDTRKCSFLRTVSRETSATNIIIYNDRIETVIEDLQVDCITARALAGLGMLFHYTRSQWQNNPNLTLCLLKGQTFQKEIEEAQKSYNFDVDIHHSKTDKQGRILVVSNITDLA